MRMQSFRLIPGAAKFGTLAISAACLGLTGCSLQNPFLSKQDASPQLSQAATQGVQMTKEPRFLGIFSPYRVDIQQGNFVSSEMMDQVREGMKRKEGLTPDQVRFILGTPLIADPFHAERWDYVFRLKRGNGEILTSHVAVFFKNGKMDRLDGSLLPTEKDYLALIASGKNASAAAETPAAK